MRICKCACHLTPQIVFHKNRRGEVINCRCEKRKQTFTVKKLGPSSYTVLARGDNTQGLTATVPIFTINGSNAKSDCDVIAFHLNKVMEVELKIELEERRKRGADKS